MSLKNRSVRFLDAEWRKIARAADRRAKAEHITLSRSQYIRQAVMRQVEEDEQQGVE